jgi:preprotein translocase subunit YajC
MTSILDFFMSTAHAANGSADAPAGGGFSFFLMMGLFLVFAYFMVWRPQAKRAKEQQQLLQSLAKGDEVITIGGLLGRVTKVADPYLTVAIANDIEVVVQKSAVAGLLPKGTIKALE